MLKIVICKACDEIVYARQYLKLFSGPLPNCIDTSSKTMQFGRGDLVWRDSV